MIGCSTGLEPYYSFSYYRSGRLGKNVKVDAPIVEEYSRYHPEADAEELKKIFVSAMELSPEEHVSVQCIIQRWIDSSISKTINAPANYSVRDVEKIYISLYKQKAKGGTVYVDGSRDAQVLSLTSDDPNLVSTTIDDYQKSKATGKERFLKNQNYQNLTSSFKHGVDASKVIGYQVDNICPLCEAGRIVMSGGCSTCTSCQAQIKCAV